MSIFNNQKVSDHHAIIPTEVRPVMSDLSNREFSFKTNVCPATSKVTVIASYSCGGIKASKKRSTIISYNFNSTVTLEVAGHTFVLKENVTTVLGFKSIRQGESITEHLV
jgi:DNA topoisomerase-3